MKITFQLIRRVDGARTPLGTAERAELAQQLEKNVPAEGRDDYVLILSHENSDGEMIVSTCPVYTIATFVAHFSNQEALSHA